MQSWFSKQFEVIDDVIIERYQGNHVPHWETSDENNVYHLSFRLHDSVPTVQRQYWLYRRQRLMECIADEQRALTEGEMEYLRQLYSEHIERYLQSGHGSCVLRKAEVASVVQGAIEYFHGKRYSLRAWCIMPNHVHVMLQIFPGMPMKKILLSWKSYTSHIINRLLGRKGKLWETDSYNHLIRSSNEYYYQMRYIWQNPDMAGLTDWPWRWSCLEEHNS